MKVLALDQSSQLVGISVMTGAEPEDLLYYKEFKLNNKDDLWSRIDGLVKEVASQIKEHNPDIIIIEDIQYQRNPQTYKKLAWIQGVLIYYMIKKGHKHDIVAPSSWRSKNKIKGRAREEQKANAIIFVQRHYGLKLTDDVAEAILLGRSYFL